MAYLRYQGGVDTLLNALDADRDLFNAELSLTRTRRKNYCRWSKSTNRWAAVGNSNGGAGGPGTGSVKHA